VWVFFFNCEAFFTHSQNIMYLLFILNNLFWFSKSYFRQLSPDEMPIAFDFLGKREIRIKGTKIKYVSYMGGHVPKIL